ncbi:MAG: FHA domain-containing protein, partial [Pseudomonadota bacterium]
MRLIFPNGEHQEIDLAKGNFAIGAAPDREVQLADAELQDHHATITVDHRGITLIADGESPRMQVNGRAVQEKAILRLGDHLLFGSAEAVLVGDRSRLASANDPGPVTDGNRSQPARFLLRGLSGLHSGQAFGIYDRLAIGPEADITVGGVSRCLLQIEDGQVFLREAEGVAVNGHPLDAGALEIGDQLICGDDRFLIEAPGFVPGKAYSGVSAAGGGGNTQVFTAPVVEPQPSPARPAADPAPSAMDPGRRDAIIIGCCIALS